MAGLLGLTNLSGAPGFAQADDPGRDDTSEFLVDYQHEDMLEPQPAAPARDASRWSAEISFTGLHTTNADQTSSNAIATIYGTPAAAIAYRANTPKGWTVSFDVTAESDLFREQPDDLNESRLTATARASHDFGVGTVTFGVRSRSSFAGTFNEHAFTRTGPFVSLRPRGTGRIRLRLDADLRFSEQPGQRRFVILGQAEVPIMDEPAIGRLAFTQELRLSRFRSGQNAGRRDLRSASLLAYTPALALPEGASLRIKAVLFRNFSNFEGREFTDLEIGSALNFVF